MFVFDSRNVKYIDNTTHWQFHLTESWSGLKTFEHLCSRRFESPKAEGQGNTLGIL